MRVAVLGAEGQLGSEIVELAEAQGHIVIRFSHSGMSPRLDVTEPEWVWDELASHQPDVVINTVALHSVDICEVSPDSAMEVNAFGARNVALACANIGAVCIYISTDYVFGRRQPEDGVAFKPLEARAPINVYGLSKALAEHFVLSAPKGVVVRVAYLFGKNGAKQKGGNFVDKTLMRLQRGDAASYYSDVTISPTYARDAAEMILQISKPGIYHAVNRGSCSVWEFASTIASMAGFKAELSAITRRERPDALRPQYTPLATSFADARPWRDALAAYLQEIGQLA